MWTVPSSRPTTIRSFCAPDLIRSISSGASRPTTGTCRMKAPERSRCSLRKTGRSSSSSAISAGRTIPRAPRLTPCRRHSRTRAFCPVSSRSSMPRRPIRRSCLRRERRAYAVDNAPVRREDAGDLLYLRVCGICQAAGRLLPVRIGGTAGAASARAPVTERDPRGTGKGGTGHPRAHPEGCGRDRHVRRGKAPLERGARTAAGRLRGGRHVEGVLSCRRIVRSGRGTQARGVAAAEYVADDVPAPSGARHARRADLPRVHDQRGHAISQIGT